MDRAEKDHQRINIAEQEDAAKPIPHFVLRTMVLAPYIATAVTLACCLTMHLAYAIKFVRKQEQQWQNATIVGLVMIFCVLEVTAVPTPKINETICATHAMLSLELRTYLHNFPGLRNGLQYLPACLRCRECNSCNKLLFCDSKVLADLEPQVREVCKRQRLFQHA
eukprot:2287617-Amphidinium_carterae.1